MLETIIVGLLLLSISAAIAYISKDHFRKAMESTKWPEYQGIITKSTKREQSDEDGTQYYADVDFEYTFNEKKYYGQSERYIGSRKRESNKNFENYQPGSSISLYVRPDKPSEFVDYQGLQSSHYARIAIIVILGLTGLSFLFR